MIQNLNFKLTNVQQIDAFTLTADVFLTNIGPNKLQLNATQFGINVDAGCLPVGTSLTNGIVAGSSQIIPPTQGFNFPPPASSSPTSLRFVQSPTPSYIGSADGFPAKAPLLTKDVPVKLGTFTIQSNMGFVSGKNPNLSLQASVGSGKTVSAAVVYENDSNYCKSYSCPYSATATNECALVTA